MHCIYRTRPLFMILVMVPIVISEHIQSNNLKVTYSVLVHALVCYEGMKD